MFSFTTTGHLRMSESGKWILKILSPLLVGIEREREGVVTLCVSCEFFLCDKFLVPVVLLPFCLIALQDLVSCSAIQILLIDVNNVMRWLTAWVCHFEGLRIITASGPTTWVSRCCKVGICVGIADEYDTPSVPMRVGATVTMRASMRGVERLACKKELMIRAPPSTMRDLIPRLESFWRTAETGSTENKFYDDVSQMEKEKQGTRGV